MAGSCYQPSLLKLPQSGNFHFKILFREVRECYNICKYVKPKMLFILLVAHFPPSFQVGYIDTIIHGCFYQKGNP